MSTTNETYRPHTRLVSETPRRSLRTAALGMAVTITLILPTLLNGVTLAAPAVSVAPTSATASGLEPSSTTLDPEAAFSLATTALIFNYVATPAVTSVEEDWELVVAQPDTTQSAPQVTTVMTPFSDVQDLYCLFALNHRVSPSYQPGGMEVQMWYQGRQLGWTGLEQQLLRNSNETVSWTQRLEIRQAGDGGDGIRLRFKVFNGHSQSWGDFGAQDTLRLTIPTSLADLSTYSSQTSVKYSGVTFASNRVQSLTLKAVRGYANSGELVFQEQDPVVVFSQASN